jgi:hypothetical protein
MAVKFKFAAERLASVCTIPEYIGALNGNLASIVRILPKMVVNGNGNYVVVAKYDDDGDIIGYEHMERAQEMLNTMTPERLAKLSKDLAKALGEVVNPPKGGG